jgi:predicted ferric reductase
MKNLIGTCAEDIFKYEHLILIGASIGVTPYASILKNVSYKLRAGEILLKKIHFFWICPSIDTFEWFGELLQTLELEMKNKNRADLVLEYKIYLTRGWSLNEAKHIVSNDCETYDLFTGLSQKTNYGRPNFDLFFKEYSSNLNENEPKEKLIKVGVFFCGPQQLSTELHNYCNLYSNDKLRFFYNKENF